MDKLQLTKTNQNKWLHNLLMFLKPVAVLYITSVITIIGMNEGIVRLQHFVPTSFFLGGATLYVLNGVLDYLNKLGASK